MKKNLGRVLVLLILTLNLTASDICDYNFKISNQTPFVKESVDIIFEVKQKDKNSVMFFDLTAKNSDDFELNLLGVEENKKSYHDSRSTYRYRLFPLKSGKIELDFNLLVSQATDESVEKFYTGNRDVINPMAAKKTDIDLKPLLFTVKKIKKDVELIGDYKLTFKIDKKEIQAFTQLNITYTLSGNGYKPNLKELLPKIEGVDIFLEKTKHKYNYALLSEKDFIIPAVNIKCFDPKKNRYYELKTPFNHIKVHKIKSETILDEQNSYPTEAFKWSSLMPFINGLLLFIAGFIVAKLNISKYIKKGQKAESKFANIKDKKELLQILISKNDNKYKSIIEQLEASIYENKKCNLKKIKDELLNL
jgi:hypothetical protein